MSSNVGITTMCGCKGSSSVHDADEDCFNDAESSPDVINLISSVKNTFLLLLPGVSAITDDNGVFGGSCSLAVFGLDSPTTWSRSSRRYSDIPLAIRQVVPGVPHDSSTVVATYPTHQRSRCGVVNRCLETVKYCDIIKLVPGDKLNDVVVCAFLTLLSARDELLAYKKWNAGIVSDRRYRECAIFSPFLLTMVEGGGTVDNWRYIRGYITCGCGKFSLRAYIH